MNYDLSFQLSDETILFAFFVFGLLLILTLGAMAESVWNALHKLKKNRQRRAAYKSLGVDGYL